MKTLLHTFFVFILLCFVNLQTFSQVLKVESGEAKDVLSGGVINGKAIYLEKPIYPLAAKAVKASGVVEVEVVVDEKGNVTSAKAISGHPLLRPSAEKAALASRFNQTFIKNKPVKVRGIIRYNFLGEIPSWLNFGYQLGLAENQEVLDEKFSYSNIKSRIEIDWKKESELVEDLYIIRFLQKKAKESTESKTSIENTEKTNTESGKDKTTEKKIKTNPKKTDKAVPFKVDAAKIESIKFGTGKSLSKESHKETIAELFAELDIRFVTFPNLNWLLKVGRSLGKIEAQLDDFQHFFKNVGELENFLAQESPGKNQLIVEICKEIIQYKTKTTLDKNDKEELKKIINRLKLFNV